MNVFLDFEASSLSDDSYPIEVGWVFEDGRGENHLIRPLPRWTDWSVRAEAIHHISRATLVAEGEPVETVAGRMMETLAGHALFASAPSWDGKWLSVLLRGAGYPRHALRLREVEIAQRLAAREILAPAFPDRAALDREVRAVMQTAHDARAERPVRHRALADAEEELATWRQVRELALALRP